MTKMTRLLIMLLTGLALLAACTATKNSYNPPPVHPPEASHWVRRWSAAGWHRRRTA